ncbi:MAG TPA: hypothetical protein VJW23_05655, partial [Propionibacteriaceae bacterium]|nr:hypothetical protein [Propionibacteriaceae bacterium]
MACANVGSFIAAVRNGAARVRLPRRAAGRNRVHHHVDGLVTAEGGLSLNGVLSLHGQKDG